MGRGKKGRKGKEQKRRRGRRKEGRERERRREGGEGKERREFGLECLLNRETQTGLCCKLIFYNFYSFFMEGNVLGIINFGTKPDVKLWKKLKKPNTLLAPTGHTSPILTGVPIRVGMQGRGQRSRHSG